MERSRANTIQYQQHKLREEVDYSIYPTPFLARHPWVGYFIFIACTLAFLLLTWQVMTTGIITRYDDPLAQQIFGWAQRQAWPVVLFMRFFSAVGRDGLALIIILLLVGWVRHRQRRELWMLIFGLLAVELWFQVLTGLIGRHRPEFKDPFETLIGFGFPSGHAATNVLFCAMILYLLLPKVTDPLKRAALIAGNLFLFFFIIFSRLFLGLHYLTDIIGGTLLGLAWGALIFTITDTYFWRKVVDHG